MAENRKNINIEYKTYFSKEISMKTKKFLFYILVVILGGCIPIMSVHPLYTKSDIIFDQKILGTWIDDPNSPQTTWEFFI